MRVLLMIPPRSLTTSGGYGVPDGGMPPPTAPASASGSSARSSPGRLACLGRGGVQGEQRGPGAAHQDGPLEMCLERVATARPCPGSTATAAAHRSLASRSRAARPIDGRGARTGPQLRREVVDGGNRSRVGRAGPPASRSQAPNTRPVARPMGGLTSSTPTGLDGRRQRLERVARRRTPPPRRVPRRRTARPSRCDAAMERGAVSGGTRRRAAARAAAGSPRRRSCHQPARLHGDALAQVDGDRTRRPRSRSRHAATAARTRFSSTGQSGSPSMTRASTGAAASRQGQRVGELEAQEHRAQLVVAIGTARR